jgi:sarcosine oxidase / L-pipecolate oxidase
MSTIIQREAMARNSESKGKVLIVGAGCFGLSTAYHLLKRGFTDVTVIDRSNELPAPDAASCDLNKGALSSCVSLSKYFGALILSGVLTVVRTSYSDPFYAGLAYEAIRSWRDESEWGDTYHEYVYTVDMIRSWKKCLTPLSKIFFSRSGVLLVTPQEDRYRKEQPYTKSAYDNDVALGVRLVAFESGDAMRSSAFPPGVPVAPFTHQAGYLNYEGGWAKAAQGISVMLKKIVALGGVVTSGKTVTKLVRRNGRTSGVKCSDGIIFNADYIILAAGSWTAASFPVLDLGKHCLATGYVKFPLQLASSRTKKICQPEYCNYPVNAR